MVDVKAIDETIKKLEQLKKLAADPALAPFLKNGAGAMRQTDAAQATLTLVQPSTDTLKGTVLSVCQELREFTIKDVLRVMTERRFPFEGDEPQKSVGNVLRVLARTGQIRIMAASSGRRPAKYAA